MSKFDLDYLISNKLSEVTKAVIVNKIQPEKLKTLVQPARNETKAVKIIAEAWTKAAGQTTKRILLVTGGISAGVLAGLVLGRGSEAAAMCRNIWDCFLGLGGFAYAAASLFEHSESTYDRAVRILERQMVPYRYYQKALNKKGLN